MRLNTRTRCRTWVVALIGATVWSTIVGAAYGAAGDLRLIGAMKERRLSVVRALVKEVDVNTAEPDGSTALHWAAHWDDLEAADVLMKAGANVNAATQFGMTALALAAENGSSPMVQKLLAAGANPNAADASGETVLIVAARSGNVAAVKALLASGADMHAATTERGQTALMWAISERHLDVVRALLENGADVRRASKSGFTPLLFAARTGSIPIGRVLLDAGAKPNDASRTGTHPLLIAIRSGHFGFAKFLLDEGADANAMSDGESALHAAVTARKAQPAGNAEAPITPDSLELVRLLVTKGAQVNARTDAVRITASIGAIFEGAFDPYTFGVGSRRLATPFWRAADTVNVPVMRALIAAGADPTMTTEDGSTPLMVAAGLGHTGATMESATWDYGRALEAVTFLLQLGVDVNAKNEAGFTAIHGTAFPGADEIAKLLVARGADLNAQDFRGRTAYRIAQGHKGSGMIFQTRPSTMEVFTKIGANVELGVDPNITERENIRAETALAAVALARAVSHKIAVESPAFAPGAPIPVDYTIDGKNVSPALAWRNLPANTKELVVTCEDIDSSTTLPFVHWVVYRIPPTASGIPEGLPLGVVRSGPLAGAVQGLQGFERGGPRYRGPAPPRGSGPHRYRFSVYALDANLDLQIGHNKVTLMEKIKDHIIGIGELTGTYERRALVAP